MPSRQRIDRAKRKAHDYERDYSGCAQSVLGAIQEEFNIGNKESFKAASALAGGIARRGETCGAIIGALSALGLARGRERIEDTETYKAAMEPSMQLCAKFMKELKRQLGFDGELKNTLCANIQEVLYGRSFDLTTEEGYQAFLEAGGHSDTGCPRVCGIAAQVVAKEISRIA